MKLCCLKGDSFSIPSCKSVLHSQTNEKVGSGNEITGIDSNKLCSEHVPRVHINRLAGGS